MKVRYLGETKEAVTAFGVTFEPGKAADVPESFRAKVEGNPFFKAGGEKKEGEGGNPPVAPNPAPETSDLKAVHRGGGSYSIMRGDEEVKEGLNKADAEAFNKLSAADQAEYVK